jgi:hypothetical protein
VHTILQSYGNKKYISCQTRLLVAVKLKGSKNCCHNKKERCKSNKIEKGINLDIEGCLQGGDSGLRSQA